MTLSKSTWRLLQFLLVAAGIVRNASAFSVTIRTRRNVCTSCPRLLTFQPCTRLGVSIEPTSEVRITEKNNDVYGTTVKELSESVAERKVEKLIETGENRIAIRLNRTEEFRNEIGVQVFELQKKLYHVNAATKQRLFDIKSEEKNNLNKLRSDLQEIPIGERGKEAEIRKIKGLIEKEEQNCIEKRKNISLSARKEKNIIMSEMTSLRLLISEKKGQIREMKKNTKKQKKLAGKLATISSVFRKEKDHTVNFLTQDIDQLKMMLEKKDLEVDEARNEINRLKSYNDKLGDDLTEMKSEESVTVDDLIDKPEQEQMMRTKYTVDSVKQKYDIAVEMLKKENAQIKRERNEAVAQRDEIISTFEAERSSIRKLTKQSFAVLKRKMGFVKKIGQ